MADINGDGMPDLVFAHYNHSGIIWIDFSGPEPKVHHAGGAEQDGHGMGVADIDGDGQADILTPNGWLKQSTPTRTIGNGTLTGRWTTPDFRSSAMT